MKVDCSYEDHNLPGRAPNAVRCSSRYATHIVHDDRGCRPVCARHALWRKTTSQAHGHSPECLSKNARWQQITDIPSGYVDIRPVRRRSSLTGTQIGQIVENRPVDTGLSLGWLLVLATAIAIPVLTLTKVGKKT